LQKSKLATPGDGFRVCVPINILSELRTTAGLTLTDGTVPDTVALETSLYGLSVAANQTHCGMYLWTVPDDYDNSADELRIRLLCNMAAAEDDDVTISPTIYRKRPNPGKSFVEGGTTYTGNGTGVALTADLGVTTSTIYVPTLTTAATDYLASTSNANTKWYEMNADAFTDFTKATSNRSLSATADASVKAGDALSIILTSSAHTTDALSIYGAELWYRSNLAFTDIDAR